MRCKSSNTRLNPVVVWQNSTALTPSSAVSFLLFFTFSGSSFLTRSIVASAPNSLSKSLQDSSSSSRSSFCSQFLRLLLASSKTCRHLCSRSGSSTDSSNLAELIQTCGTGSSQQRTRHFLSELFEFCIHLTGSPWRVECAATAFCRDSWCFHTLPARSQSRCRTSTIPEKSRAKSSDFSSPVYCFYYMSYSDII